MRWPPADTHRELLARRRLLMIGSSKPRLPFRLDRHLFPLPSTIWLSSVSSAILPKGVCDKPTILHSTRIFLLYIVPLAFHEVEHGTGGVEHVGARTKDGGDAILFQEIIVLAWHHAAADHDDVFGAARLQLVHELR